MSAYAASKHAAEAFTSSLSLEMEPFGIQVIVLNPSFHRTNIVLDAGLKLKQAWNELDSATKSAYGESFYNQAQTVSQTGTNMAFDPVHVLTSFRHASIAEYPKSQYLVGIDAKFVFPLLNIIPVALVKYIGKRMHSKLYASKA
jgi:NAD(P)-dependent dehydrogenase (short-subunit alcohol dehydrogenase family)